MTDIPKARAILSAAIESSDGDWDQLVDAVKEALSLMTRTCKPKRHTGHQPMTAELGREARRLRRTKYLSCAAIGAILNVDSGRVSEAINGMWH